MCGVFRDLGLAHVVDGMGAPALLVLFGSGDWRLEVGSRRREM